MFIFDYYDTYHNYCVFMSATISNKYKYICCCITIYFYVVALLNKVLKYNILIKIIL